MKLIRLIGVIVVLQFSLLAQSHITSGLIEGTVRDESGAVIPDVVIGLTHLGIGISRTAKTSPEGFFTFPLLPVGSYELSVRRTGFAAIKRTGISVAIGQTRSIEIVMTPSAVETSLEVKEQAETLDLFQTETSTHINATAVQSLPLNGRRFLDLALLAPAVYQEKERGQLSLSGARGINSAIHVDGADFNQPFFGGQRGGERSNFAFVVSQEAIQEFRINHANFSAEFGRSSGGIINAITKSGSNDLHGNVFYFLRHRESASRDILGLDQAPTRQQFGASLGGPLVKDKTFFFTVYDGQVESQPLTVRFTLTGGGPPDLVNKQGTFETTNDVNTYLAKVDHRLSSLHTVNGRYSFSRNHAENATTFGFTSNAIENNGTERDYTHTGILALNSSFSSGILNELRVHYSYESRPRLNNGESDDFVSRAGPEVRIIGCCTLGGLAALPARQHDDRWQLADNLSLINGRHHLKLGFDLNHTFVSQDFRGNWRGLYIFTGLQNYLRVANQQINPVTGRPFPADALRVFFGSGTFRANFWDVAGFLQDSIRIASRSSLYLGLRYEAALMPQPPAPNPTLPLTSRIPSDTRMWQPRAGFSWSPGSSGRTVLRLGGGIFNGRTPYLLVNQVFNSNANPDVGVTFDLIAPQIDAVQRLRPEFVFPFVPETSDARNSSYFTSLGLNVRPDASFFAPDFRNPRSLQYGASVERQLFFSLVGSLTYVHNNTVRLERIRDVNLAPPVLGPDNSTPPVLRPRFNLLVRPNPAFGILRQLESSARSNFDALIVALRRRHGGLQFQTSYTLSYNRDDDSNERNFQGITYENAYDLQPEYRWSRNDIRHRWVLSGIWELPTGFQLSSVVEWRTAAPFTAFTGVDSNADAQFTDRPIIAGIPLLRNAFRQPNHFQQDVRVTKQFRFGESRRVELIAELFNLWNTGNYVFTSSVNEQGPAGAVGALWGTAQTPLPTFRTKYLPNGSLNLDGLRPNSPFQLQVAVKYHF